MSSKPERLAVVIEAGAKKAFASALDWPGWSRSAKTPDDAIERLLAYAPRYEPVAKLAGLELPTAFDAEVVEQLEGGAGTDFGVPGAIHEAERAPVGAAEAEHLASLVGAAWTTFDRVFDILNKTEELSTHKQWRDPSLVPRTVTRTAPYLPPPSRPTKGTGTCPHGHEPATRRRRVLR